MNGNLNGLFGDLYTLKTRRHALVWGYSNLKGQALRDFYRHARSVPHDQDLVDQIRAKIVRQGIGADPGEVKEPPLVPLEPPPDKKPDSGGRPLEPPPDKKPDSGGSLLWLILILSGLGYLAFRKKK